VPRHCHCRFAFFFFFAVAIVVAGSVPPRSNAWDWIDSSVFPFIYRSFAIVSLLLLPGETGESRWNRAVMIASASPNYDAPDGSPGRKKIR